MKHQQKGARPPRGYRVTDYSASKPGKVMLRGETVSVWGDASPFHRGFYHAFRCATKCLGIDSIKLRTQFSGIQPPTLVSEWKTLADHLADVLAHPVGANDIMPFHRLSAFRQRILTNRSWRTLLRWCTSSGGYLRRARRTVATFLQLKRAFPPLPEEMEVAALKQHAAIISCPLARDFTDYDLVDDIIENHFHEGWCRRGKLTSLPALHNRSVNDGRTSRDLNGDAPGVYPRIRPTSAGPLVRQAAMDEYDHLYRCLSGFDGMYPVSAVAVPDAGKFRVITKSSRLLKVLEPFQQLLHRHLLRDPTFRYTGQEIGDDFPTFVGSHLPARGRFLSVDYSQATDCVDGSFQATLIGRIVDRSGSFDLACLRRIAEKELSLGRVIRYPDGSEAIQQRGSLMGSLLSFPLLCLWNESLLRNSIESGACIVNGDDALTRCSLSEAVRWRTLSSRLGLTPSPGKVYWSNRFVTFNSRYFYLAGGRLRPIDHVPVNLFLAQMDGDSYNRVPERYQHHYRRWVKVPKNEFRNLRGPRCYGGLGGHINSPLTKRELHTLRASNAQMKKKCVPLLVARLLRDDEHGPNCDLSWIRASKAFVPMVEERPPRPKGKLTGGFDARSTWRKPHLRSEGDPFSVENYPIVLDWGPLPRLAGI